MQKFAGISPVTLFFNSAILMSGEWKSVRAESSTISGKLIALFLLFLVLFLIPGIKVKSEHNDKFVSFLLILDQGSGYEELENWLTDIRFNNFTFAVCGALEADNYWLDNSTRLNTLKNYGKLIPVTLYMASMTPNERVKIVDSLFNTWTTKVGYSPKGFFDFQPDTYTANYLEEKNVSYVVGYCFDQYAIDWMTERGGWQLPYFAHHGNVLRPNNVQSQGIVVFPHLTWDWSASFTETHHLCTHPLALQTVFDGNMTSAETYFQNLIDNTLEACEPLGLVSVQFEWVWAGIDGGIKDYAKIWIKNLLATKPVRFWTYEDIAGWFKANYALTPDYSVNFVSPYNNEKIEWYYCQTFRIARINGNVVSYVKYDVQADSPFLASSLRPDFASPWSLGNCIDTSLSFTIDALGGGLYRNPVLNTPFPFEGQLSQFPATYRTSNSPDSFFLLVLLTSSAFLAVTILLLHKRSTAANYMTLRKSRTVFSKVKRFLTRNPWAVLFAGFLTLFLTSAVLLVQGNSALANIVALCAFSLLATEVVLQVIFVIRRGKGGSI